MVSETLNPIFSLFQDPYLGWCPYNWNWYIYVLVPGELRFAKTGGLLWGTYYDNGGYLYVYSKSYCLLFVSAVLSPFRFWCVVPFSFFELSFIRSLQYQSQQMGVYCLYQVNDYISKGADTDIYCSDNFLTFFPLIWWHLLQLGVFLVMYNLLSLNWHVSVSQNSYTSKQGFCCSHGFMSLVLIQI